MKIFKMLGASAMMVAATGVTTGFAADKVDLGKREYESNCIACQATETIAAFAAMCLCPQWFGPLAYGFTTLCAFTTAQRIGWGWQRLRDGA